MCIDGSSPIDFAQLSFHGCKAQTHLCSLSVREDFDGALIDGSRSRKTIVGGSLGDVDGVHLRKKYGD